MTGNRLVTEGRGVIKGCVLLRSAGGDEGGESDGWGCTSKADVDLDKRTSNMT